MLDFRVHVFLSNFLLENKSTNDRYFYTSKLQSYSIFLPISSSFIPKLIEIQMGFSLITPSTSSLSYFSSPIIKKPIYPRKITTNSGFSRSRIVALSSASPEWVPSNSEIITPTVGESPNSQNPESSDDALTNPNGENLVKLVQSAESSVERVNLLILLWCICKD